MDTNMKACLFVQIWYGTEILINVEVVKPIMKNTQWPNYQNEKVSGSEKHSSKEVSYLF